MAVAAGGLSRGKLEKAAASAVLAVASVRLAERVVDLAERVRHPSPSARGHLPPVVVPKPLRLPGGPIVLLRARAEVPRGRATVEAVGAQHRKAPVIAAQAAAGAAAAGPARARVGLTAGWSAPRPLASRPSRASPLPHLPPSRKTLSQAVFRSVPLASSSSYGKPAPRIQYPVNRTTRRQARIKLRRALK